MSTRPRDTPTLRAFIGQQFLHRWVADLLQGARHGPPPRPSDKDLVLCRTVRDLYPFLRRTLEVRLGRCVLRFLREHGRASRNTTGNQNRLAYRLAESLIRFAAKESHDLREVTRLMTSRDLRLSMAGAAAHLLTLCHSQPETCPCCLTNIPCELHQPTT